MDSEFRRVGLNSKCLPVASLAAARVCIDRVPDDLLAMTIAHVAADGFRMHRDGRAIVVDAVVVLARNP